MSSWILSTERFLLPYTPGFLANGYIGMTSDWLGIGPSDCHIADVFNRAADPADTVRVRLPSFNGLDLYNGLRWLGGLEPNTTLLRNYAQSLDLHTATLNTDFRWHDGDQIIDITTTSFVCRHSSHVAVQRLTLTPLFDGPLQLRVFIDERRGDLHIDELSYTELYDSYQAGYTWVVSAAPTQHDSMLAIATTLRFEGPESQLESTTPQILGQNGILLSFMAKAGASYTLTRYVAVAETSPELTLAQARAARSTGYDAMLQAHSAAWEQLWEGAIDIEGDDHAQAVVRSAQYAVLSSMRAGSGWSVSPMGLSSRGYGGHIFWDADIWIYPAVLLTHPELAQGCVNYRCNRLDGARAKASQYGYEGAMFPWEGDDLGVETTPDWAPCGRYEQHITACVALAAWQWWQATQDLEWLRNKGWPLLRDCATFWVSRVTPRPQLSSTDPRLRYHILDVQAADEYALHVDDNAWTNASAARCLQLAVKAAALLREQAAPEWAHVAERIYLPFDEQRQLTLEYAGYTNQLIKQADVVLLNFPLEWPLPTQVASNNERFYAERVDANHGPAMTYAIHAILAAATGDQDRMSDYLRLSYEHNLRPPFLSFSETPDQNYCTFVTGAGGLLQALLFGCLGARLSDEGLTFPHAPLLPKGWQRMSVRLRCRGKNYQVTVTPAGREVQ